MAAVGSSMMYGASLSTIVCMFVVVYSLALCLLASNSTVTGAAMDAAMAFLVDWCFPSSCHCLVYLLVKCCIISSSFYKQAVGHISQAANDILTPALPILSNAGVFLLACAVLLVFGAIHFLLEVTKSAFILREQHDTADCTHTAEDPMQGCCTAHDYSITETDPATCDMPNMVAALLAESEATEDAESEVVEPRTPDRLSDALFDGYSHAEPALSGEVSLDISVSTCSSISISSDHRSIVAFLVAAYERNLAAPFVHHAPEVTAACPGTVAYLTWSFDTLIEALQESDSAAGPQPEALTGEELLELGIRPGIVDGVSAMANTYNEAVEVANLRLRNLC